MATYNGERFIREQLESLAHQTLLPYELIVRDDASTDRTLCIVEEFSRHAPFRVTIHKNSVRLGYRDNFIQAAGLAKGNWIAFCDQDDVWLPHKLERVLAVVARHSGLVLVIHSAELVDEALKRTGRRFPDIKRRKIIGTLEHSRIAHYPGFCCTFSRDLLDEVRWDSEDPQNPYIHDQWICFLANVLGRTCYIPEPLVLYRRHDRTVTANHARRPLSMTINDARSASGSDYRKLSQFISGYAELLQRRSRETGSRAVSVKLRRAADHYTRFAGLLQSRAHLYEARGFFTRMETFLALLMQGAYIGRRGIVLGPRALMKDAVIASFGLSRIALRR
jgi:glycosyltransferase involved in cell wall biosynthesis